MNCTASGFSNALSQAGDSRSSPGGTHAPPISGQVLEASPASIPATSAPIAICTRMRKGITASTARSPAGTGTMPWRPATRSDSHTVSARMMQASVMWVVSRYWLTSTRSVRPDVTIHQPTAPCSPPSASSRTPHGLNHRGSIPRTQKTTKGTKKTSPMERATSRCAHSHR
ncbi:MAG: hypothetical protein AcusKO_48900 [Acuticoccus sp.]